MLTKFSTIADEKKKVDDLSQVTFLASWHPHPDHELQDAGQQGGDMVLLNLTQCGKICGQVVDTIMDRRDMDAAAISPSECRSKAEHESSQYGARHLSAQ
jgi:hypothetical protein